MSTGEIIWVVIGAAGQLCFGGRMLLQWFASERLGRSVVPAAFWHLSLVGGVIMLAYACWRMDPVFIGGQILSLGIYARNLVLLRNEKRCTMGAAIPNESLPFLHLRRQDSVASGTARLFFVRSRVGRRRRNLQSRIRNA